MVSNRQHVNVKTQGISGLLRIASLARCGWLPSVFDRLPVRLGLGQGRAAVGGGSRLQQGRRASATRHGNKRLAAARAAAAGGGEKHAEEGEDVTQGWWCFAFALARRIRGTEVEPAASQSPTETRRLGPIVPPGAGGPRAGGAVRLVRAASKCYDGAEGCSRKVLVQYIHARQMQGVV